MRENHPSGGYRRAAMSRICARPGCPRHAVATLSYAYSDGVVWVEDLAAEAHPMVHDLCAHHADHLSVPRGWECRDVRAVATIGTGARRLSA
jgi:hypothetical protein